MTFTAAHYQSGELIEFAIEDGEAIGRRSKKKATDLVFGPGFVDLQCNGFQGVDFNRSDSEPEVLAEAIRAMWEHGTTEVLPTFIPAPTEVLEECIFDMTQALAANPEVAKSVPGFHLEGPFISPQEGARGAHAAANIKGVSTKLWRELQEIAQGRIRMVTLAPEVRGAVQFIEQLRAANVVPAIGHTMANAATIHAAADAGALMSTHLGNGCPHQIHRHENPIFAQLAEDRLSASFIADGIHLPAEALKSLWRAKGAGRGILVTDAMAAAGAPPGRYSLGELEVQVGEDRVVRQPRTKNLAGSALTMEDAIANLVRMAGVSLAEAWDAASIRPWEVLRKAGAVKKKPETVTVARWSSGELKVVATFRGTRVLWVQE